MTDNKTIINNTTVAECECGNKTDLKKVPVGGSYEGNAYETWCQKCLDENEKNEDVLDVFESLEKLENIGDVSLLKKWFYSIPASDTAERDKALSVLYDIYSLHKNK